MHPILKKSLRRAFLLSLVLFLGLLLGYLTNHVFSENARFQRLSEEIFRSEVCASTLTLHYTLANPQKQGITPPPPTLGTVPTDMTKTYQTCAKYEKKLRRFSPSRLSRENQITRDMLLLYFHTQKSLGDNYLLAEYISPSLGIQAQLPVLLAEYAFYKKEDISDYLKLLSQITPYFRSILDFEKKKSQAGFFMCDASLDRVLAQCREFIQSPDSNYMQDIFARKLREYGHLTDSACQKLLTYHKKLLREQVIPAYQYLMNGLETLRGTGKNARGLAYFKGGRDYYRYLIKSETGSYLSVEKIQKRLAAQLLFDYKEIRKILQKRPVLINKLTEISDSIRLSPQQMLEKLQSLLLQDFPALEAPSCELRYVHDSMKEFLSPAFYLTPPADTGTPNVIYLNPDKSSGSLELFGTLAHEGFPGHLYQTVYFGQKSPSHLRYLLTSGGYVEGWATYIESYAYRYSASLLTAPFASEAVQLAWLNRSMNLCIYSLLDIGIHYNGWEESRAAAFLKGFGIRNPSTVRKIYRYIVETPANYLKYYLGSLQFLDLKKRCQMQLGDAFDLKTFHSQILEIGPVPFPVLEKYMKNFSR